MSTARPVREFTIPVPRGVSLASVHRSVDTVLSNSVSQILSIPVTQFIPREGEGDIKIEGTLPKTKEEAEGLDTICNGPIWRLVGNILAFESANKTILSEADELLLVEQYFRAYIFLCQRNGFKAVSRAGLEDAFYNQRTKRKVPADVHPVAWAVRMANSEPLPPIATKYQDDEARRLLVAVCFHLSNLSDGGRFFLGCRDLQKHMGFHGHSKWAVILQQFCSGRPPILRELSKGRQFTTQGPQATEYEWVSGDGSRDGGDRYDLQ
jgi:hypothetical protein